MFSINDTHLAYNFHKVTLIFLIKYIILTKIKQKFKN